MISLTFGRVFIIPSNGLFSTIPILHTNTIQVIHCVTMVQEWACAPCGFRITSPYEIALSLLYYINLTRFNFFLTKSPSFFGLEIRFFENITNTFMKYGDFRNKNTCLVSCSRSRFYKLQLFIQKCKLIILQVNSTFR